MISRNFSLAKHWNSNEILFWFSTKAVSPSSHFGSFTDSKHCPKSFVRNSHRKTRRARKSCKETLLKVFRISVLFLKISLHIGFHNLNIHFGKKICEKWNLLVLKCETCQNDMPQTSRTVPDYMHFHAPAPASALNR